MKPYSGWGVKIILLHPADGTCEHPYMPALTPCGGGAGWAKIGAMKAPAITLRCDCGADGRAKYGERWTCESCGRVYDTTEIPEGEYRAVASLDLRYRLFG